MEPEFGGADAVNGARFDRHGEVEVDGAVDGAAGFDATTEEVVVLDVGPGFDTLVEIEAGVVFETVSDDTAAASGDTAAASGELDIDGSLLDTIEQELAEVERALALIDEGTYGQCEACGGSIDDAVLDRTPTSRFCAEHLPLSLR